MSESEKLPETWEEYQSARRSAYVLGWRAGEELYSPTDLVESYARRLFPIRKKVPRKVKLPNFAGMVEMGDCDGEIKFTPIGQDSCVWMRRDDVETMLDLLEHPYDEVEE